MFGLIEIELVPRPSFWGRLLYTLRRESAVHVSEERVWGVLTARALIRLWCDDAPENSRRRIELALERLQLAGVRGVVVPRGFAYADLLPQYGLTASSPVPLYRRLAARLAASAADTLCVEASRLKVSIIAQYLTPEVSAAAETLCTQSRHIFLSLDRRDGGALCSALRRHYGLSVVENPTEEQMADSDVYLVFDGGENNRKIPAKNGSAVLLLGGGQYLIPPGRLVADGAKLAPPVRMQKDWPWDADHEALLTALLAAGAVSAAEIQIRGLTWQGGAAV